jgi:hypothetical protein
VSHLRLLYLLDRANTHASASSAKHTRKVVEEHMAALNACDWTRLMEQFLEDVEFFAPNGNVVRSRRPLGDLFGTLVKKPSAPGMCGLIFTPEHTFRVGGAINPRRSPKSGQ